MFALQTYSKKIFQNIRVLLVKQALVVVPNNSNSGLSEYNMTITSVKTLGKISDSDNLPQGL